MIDIYFYLSYRPYVYDDWLASTGSTIWLVDMRVCVSKVVNFEWHVCLKSVAINSVN